MTALHSWPQRATARMRWWADAKQSLQSVSRHFRNRGAGEHFIQISSCGVKLPRLGSRSTGAMINLDWDQFDSSGPTIVRELVRKHGFRRQVSIVIARADVLKKEINFPSTASGKLDHAVKFETGRQSPVGIAEIYFDHQTITTDWIASKLVVEIRMIKKALLDRAFASCRLVGLEPVTVGIEGDEQPFRPAGLVLNRFSLALAVWQRWNITALFLLALLLLISSEIGFAHRQEQIATATSMQLNAARRQANTVAGLLKQLTQEHDKIAFIEGQRRKRLLIKILTQLTLIVPSDAWIYEFQLKGDEGRIRGFASDAAKLLPLFEHSELFQGAQFRAPVTQGPRPGIERFDLSFKLKESAV